MVKFHHVLKVIACSLDIRREPPLVSQSLDAADGIVFIADSNPDKTEQNVEYLDFLFWYMNQSGRELTADKLDAEPVNAKWWSLGNKTLRANKVPWVLAYNKRDLSNRMSCAQMDSDLKRDSAYTCESSTIEGFGTFVTLKYLNHAMTDGVHKRKSWWKGLEVDSGGN